MAIFSKQTILLICIIFSLSAHSASFLKPCNIGSPSNYNFIEPATKDTFYEFIARFVEATPIEAACNDAFGFAVIQKFELLHTIYPKYKEKFVLNIQPCPEEAKAISWGREFIKCL